MRIKHSAAYRYALAPMQGVPVILNGVRVLIVEDEPLIAMELAQIIEDAGGIIIGSARTQTDAIALAQNTDFDMALLDVRVRDGTTFELAAILFDKQTPFVFCTGDSEQRDEFRDWAEVPIVIKPHSPEIIIATLSKFLTARK